MKEHPEGLYARNTISLIQPILRFIFGNVARLLPEHQHRLQTRAEGIHQVPLLLSLAGRCCPRGLLCILQARFMTLTSMRVSFECGDRPSADPDCMHPLLWLQPGDFPDTSSHTYGVCSEDPLCGAAVIGAWRKPGFGRLRWAAAWFIYYMMMYVKQNGATNDTSVDIVQKYSPDYQVHEAFNKTMMGDDRHLRGRDSGCVPDPPPVPQLRPRLSPSWQAAWHNCW